MSILTAILRPLFDVLLSPFRSLNPLVGITLAALVITVLVLLVLKATSNQKKLDAVKRKIHAGLFEIRLFNDDPRAILRAQWDIVRHNGTYLALWLVPLLWMIVPILLILGQLQFHYGYQGLAPGEQTLVTVKLKEGASGRPDAALEAPAGLRVETPAVWVPSQNELTWRVAAEEWGSYKLAIRLDGAVYDKEVDVAHDVGRRSPVRPSSFGAQILYPAEAPLPADSPIESIAIEYPPGDAGVGWESELAWAIILFLLTFVFAFALRKPLGVTF